MMEKNMTEPKAVEALLTAAQRYFDLMYDCDVSNFDRVFRSTAQLHGFREGKMNVWSAEAYKDVLSKRQSPKSQQAPREEAILLLEFASPTQALLKVRVRIGEALFTDFLTYHRIDGDWLITSKAYHLEAPN